MPGIAKQISRWSRSAELNAESVDWRNRGPHHDRSRHLSAGFKRSRNLQIGCPGIHFPGGFCCLRLSTSWWCLRVSCFSTHHTRKMTAEQRHRAFYCFKPQVAIGSKIVIYGAFCFFLYFTLSLCCEGQRSGERWAVEKILPKCTGYLNLPLVYTFFTGLRLVHFCVRP